MKPMFSGEEQEAQILDATPPKPTDLTTKDIVKGFRVVPLAAVESKVTVPAYESGMESQIWSME